METKKIYIVYENRMFYKIILKTFSNLNIAKQYKKELENKNGKNNHQDDKSLNNIKYGIAEIEFIVSNKKNKEIFEE